MEATKDEDQQTEFHCPVTRELMTTDSCESCSDHQHCDMYITMVNEGLDD